MNIMVVEDDDDFREVLGLALSAQGHDVEAATDGEEALGMLDSGSHPSIILLDMMMPRLDGPGFMRAVRGRPSGSDIPVVVITGHYAARETAQELGAAACLVKPVELSKLVEIVSEVGGSHPPRASA